MTTKEFNEKYSAYLEEGHYGMAIENEAVIAYVDKAFEELVKVPGFYYSQIKTKFGMARAYLYPNSIDNYAVENEIDRILVEQKLNSLKQNHRS